MKGLKTPALAALTVLSVAACNDDINAPEGTLNDDVAFVAADGALDDLGHLGDPGAFRPGGPGLDHAITVTYYDADGNEQPGGYDELTTASITIVSEASGEVSREFWEAAVQRRRTLTISGLEGQETTRILNGSGSEEISRSRHMDGDTRTYDMLGTSTTADVVIPVPREEGSWPLSGAITRTMSVTITNGPNGDETREHEVVITFNGTQFPEMTVDGEPYEVDLEAGPRGRPSRRRGGGHGGSR